MFIWSLKYKISKNSEYIGPTTENILFLMKLMY